MHFGIFLHLCSVEFCRWQICFGGWTPATCGDHAQVRWDEEAQQWRKRETCGFFEAEASCPIFQPWFADMERNESRKPETLWTLMCQELDSRGGCTPLSEARKTTQIRTIGEFQLWRWARWGFGWGHGWRKLMISMNRAPAWRKKHD